MHTTAHHPFWDATTGDWVDAADLIPGESTLVGPDGQIQYVTDVRNFTGAKVMRDLTVAVTHTYYVLAGKQPVLVHNNNGTERKVCDLTLGPDGITKQEGVSAERGDRVLPHEQTMINGFGDRNGCSTPGCGATVSGYADGHWTGDHSPANKLAPDGPWTLCPHCKKCTKTQGGVVSGLKQEFGAYDFPPQRTLVDARHLNLIQLGG
ncbi:MULTISPECIES: polymorphic toxin-type HINT domain-containing protein [Micromonospora]|uniref:polymorphic toxin-type HINT domain-containing protein n=1 Tax=Micromonospora TaxID=1873 RepID=UPI0009F25211|nr:MULTISPECIES: polymorphic toxin-type HINT domain-containing protein [Micromonospora]